MKSYFDFIEPFYKVSNYRNNENKKGIYYDNLKMSIQISTQPIIFLVIFFKNLGKLKGGDIEK